MRIDWDNGTCAMPDLIDIGLFREFTDDPDERKEFPSIHDAIATSPHEHEREIAAYLRGAVCLGARGAYYEDVLNPSKQVGLLRHTYTDGTFAWSLDLAYYVETYHVRLPKNFLDHLAARRWTPPTKREVKAMICDL